jgi:hypothetical protein
VSSGVLTLSSGSEPDTAVDSDNVWGNLTLDFGFYTPLRLGDIVWVDLDNDGFFDPEVDDPLAGAVVSLFKGDGTTPAVDADGNSVASQTTTDDGEYLFANLAPGQYVVKVTAPAGFRSSDDQEGTPFPDNDSDGDDNGNGTSNSVASGVVTLSSHGEPASAVDSDDTSGNLTVDFGFYTPLRLGNLVWEDADNNGVHDAGERPLAGAVVTLLDSDALPAMDADGKPVPSQTTVADGLYLFTNLAPGYYRVQVTAPIGFRSSTDVATTTDPDVRKPDVPDPA